MSQNKSPKDNHYQSCGRKVRYPDEANAVKKAAQRFRHGAEIMRPYPCQICNGWHLTSMPVGELSRGN